MFAKFACGWQASTEAENKLIIFSTSDVKDDKISASEIYVKGDYKIDSKTSFYIVFSGDIASTQSMVNENCCRYADFYHTITHSDKGLNEQERYEQQRN